MSAALLLPVFPEPALASQRCFRAAINALAHPGEAQALVEAPRIERLGGAAYGLCLSLFESHTPVWLAPSFDTPAIRANLAFHCGCPLVTERAQARFALLDEGCLTDLSGFDPGHEDNPELSCTLLVQLDRLDGGAPLGWHSPRQPRHEVALPVPGGFWEQRRRAEHLPCGLDLLFVAGERVLGLPRRVSVDPLH